VISFRVYRCVSYRWDFIKDFYFSKSNHTLNELIVNKFSNSVSNLSKSRLLYDLLFTKVR